LGGASRQIVVSSELLGFVGAISDPPLLEPADRARQLMALFANVQAGLASAA
jgi:hypothetical protein